MKFDHFHRLTGAFLLSGSTFSALSLTPMEGCNRIPLRFCYLSLLTNLIIGSSQVTGNIFVQTDMINDHAYTGNTHDLALKHIFHLACWSLPIQADDIVLDQHRDIPGTIQLASSLQLFDALIDGVQEGIFSNQEVPYIDDTGHLQQRFLEFFALCC